MEPGKEVIDRSSLYDAANSVLYQALRAESSAGQAMINAPAAYRAGDPDQALCRYLRAPEPEPKRYGALVWVGRIRRVRGNNGLAELAFAGVLEKEPENVQALTELSLLHLARRSEENALASLELALRFDQQRLVAGGGQAASPAGVKVDAKLPLKLYDAWECWPTCATASPRPRATSLGPADRDPFGSGLEQRWGFLLPCRTLAGGRAILPARHGLRWRLQASVAQLRFAVGTHGAL